MVAQRCHDPAPLHAILYPLFAVAVEGAVSLRSALVSAIHAQHANDGTDPDRSGVDRKRLGERSLHRLLFQNDSGHAVNRGAYELGQAPRLVPARGRQGYLLGRGTFHIRAVAVIAAWHGGGLCRLDQGAKLRLSRYA